MGFSDCSRCWDTPCECGLAGYVTIWAPESMRAQLRDLSPERRDFIKQRLREKLEELLCFTAEQGQ
jgi:hypothetical protein